MNSSFKYRLILSLVCVVGTALDAVCWQPTPQVESKPISSDLRLLVDDQIDMAAKTIVQRNDHTEIFRFSNQLFLYSVISALMPEVHASESSRSMNEEAKLTRINLRTSIVELLSKIFNGSDLEYIRRTGGEELEESIKRYLLENSHASKEEKVKTVSALIHNKLMNAVIQPLRDRRLTLDPLIEISIIRFTLEETIFQGESTHRLKSDNAIKDILKSTGATWRSAPLLSPLNAALKQELDTVTGLLITYVDWQKDDIAALNEYVQILKANNSSKHADELQKQISELEGGSYSWWVALAAVPFSIFAFLTLLLFTKPLWLLTLHRKLAIYDVAAQIPIKPLSIGLQVLLRITLVPLFIYNRRTLDAWVERHASTIRNRFEAQSTVAAHEVYVPLPVSLHSAFATLIFEPSPSQFGMLLNAKRSIIEIIGPGGSGKSSLAIQIARWVLDKSGEESLAPHRMLPFWIEEDFSDLSGLLHNKLRAWLGEDVEPHFIEMLLKKKRLLIIIDGLSERDKPTQKLVRQIHASCPVNALVLTARLPINLEAGGEIKLYPQPLTSTTLLHLLTTLISMHRFNRGEDHAKPNAFSSIEDQLELGKKLASLIQRDQDERSITPLIVKLFVDRAIELFEQQDSIDKLPNSIPEVYFDYLRRVNPSGDGITNQIPDEEMMRSAEVLGELCLGKDFVPREVTKNNARLALAKHGWALPESRDPIRRLVDNGVLVERISGTDNFLRFMLDPIAEFLGAMAWARHCSDNAVRWRELEEHLEKLSDAASGFRMALRLTREVYGEEHGWIVQPS